MAKITEDYVSFETAKLLKKNGFNGEKHKHYWGYEPGKEFLSSGSYNPEYDYPAPTIYMTMKQLREVHNLHIEARITNHSMSSLFEVIKYYWIVFNSTNAKWVNESSVYTSYFNTCEEACEAAIKYCLENLI